MAALSKYFKIAMSSATCRDIVHPHTNSCLLAASEYFFRPTFTAVQFFIPLFMVSMAARKGKVDQQLFKETVKNMVGAVSAGVLSGSVGTMFMCIPYKFFRRFHSYSIVAIPGFLGALSICAVPNKIAVMFSHSALVMVAEVFIKRQGGCFFKCLDRSVWFRSFVFVTLSAIILDSLRKLKPDISWFIQPVRKRSKRRFEDYDESPLFDSIVPICGNVCSHKNGCDAFSFKELKSYFQIGIAIELVQTFLRNFGLLKRNLFRGVWGMIRNFNINFILLSPAISIDFTDLKRNSAISWQHFGWWILLFISKLSFLFYAIACIIEMLWQRMLKHKNRLFNYIRFFNQLPLARIFYPIFMEFLFHMRSFYPWQTPGLCIKVMNLVSHQHVEEMLMNVYKFTIPAY